MTASESDENEQANYQGADVVTLTRFSTAWEAEILRARLQEEGIFAAVADAHTITMNWLYSNAMGGVRVQVPQGQLAAAREVLVAMQRGDFELRDDDIV